MAKDNFKAAAAKLQQASRLGSLTRHIRRTQPPTTPSTEIVEQQKPPAPMTAAPNQPYEGGHPPHYPTYRPPQPVRTGFGLGLGFAAGTALFRLGIFLIGVVLMFAFFASIFDAIGF